MIVSWHNQLNIHDCTLTLYCFTDRIFIMESKKELISYLNNISILLLGLLFFAFPILFVTFTTDFFILPKQILLGGVALVSLLIFVSKMTIEGSVRLRRTFFDLPIILFTLMVFLSSIFAVNRFDSLIAFVPLLFIALAFFIIVNTVRNQKVLLLLIVSLLLSGVIVSTISIFSFFKIYLLPFAITQTQTFTPLGSLLDQAIYLGLLLPIALYFVWPRNPSVENQTSTNMAEKLGLTAVSIILLIGFLLTSYEIFNPPTPGQRLILLPFDTGFQTAFAAMSQDTGRLLQGFLFGSGFGTYIIDFTRFKSVAFNQNQTLWALTFVRSSSFILELLATIGILGLLSFIFLIIRGVKTIIAKSIGGGNPISISLILGIIALFILPVGFTIQALFFILLGLFSVLQGLKNKEHKNFFDIELKLVALKKGLFNVEPLTPTALNFPQQDRSQNDASRILPVIFGIIILVVVGILGFFSGSYLISDLEFQSSLIAASKNKGSETYQKQAKAISTFPYRDGYYRIFSQTNLSLANSLAAAQPKDGSPSATTQQNIYRLIQQSINAGRTATLLAPQTSLNWQNLSSIYRSLIGFGQNAESFAIATQQQAVLLDPNNPQQYIVLGGIYYQLGLWDNAQNQFQIAVNLKSDFANAHYNLGHALENKNDLNNALAQYNIVKGLVLSDQNSLKQITSEIEALQNKLEGKTTAETIPPSIVPPLNLSTPSAQLPPREPPVEIPPPTSATESAQ